MNKNFGFNEFNPEIQPIQPINSDRLTIENDSSVRIGDKINSELREIPEINIENFDSIKKEISQKIGIENEEDCALLESMIGLRLNIIRNIERVKMSNGNEKRSLLRNYAIEDSEWMDLIAEHIISINNDSSIKKKDKLNKIHLFWKDLEKAYKDFEIFYKDSINGLSESGYGFDDGKKGILGQVAAEDLMNGINEISEELNIKKVSVRSSTSKEDVDENIDFFVDVEYSNGLTETMPCQAKAHKNTSYTGRFLLDNIITRATEISSNELKLSRDIKVPSAVEEKTIEDLKIFKKKALKKYKEGLFIMVPYGKAVYRKSKRKVEEVNLLGENGQVHKHLKDAFILQLKERVFEA
ncbi:hypothetical protein KAT63_04970 [Candidatus Parcubacteria bacterium]|nr:hypothetical protein [Candidatus Parcubacteria bacterium]